MNQQLRRRIASAALIIGFFVLWEVLCWLFNVSDIVLPKPSQILVTLVDARRRSGRTPCRRSTRRWSASPSAS